jgi:hypothetical protein
MRDGMMRLIRQPLKSSMLVIRGCFRPKTARLDVAEEHKADTRLYVAMLNSHTEQYTYCVQL